VNDFVAELDQQTGTLVCLHTSIQGRLLEKVKYELVSAKCLLPVDHFKQWVQEIACYLVNAI
jgi:hypothetical protein